MPKKILFVSLSPLIFDATTPEREPLGGTESCICYLAWQLAQNGHAITLAARLPTNTPDSLVGVRHRRITIVQNKEFFAAENFDVIITSNAAVACPRFKEFSPASLNLFWDHLPPQQPAIEPLRLPQVREAIDGIVYVSEWQKSVTEKKFGALKSSCVIGNGLTPAFENMFASSEELQAAKQNRAAYTSVPERGLAVLLDVMDGLKTETKLDLFSSLRVYQKPDDECATLLDRARKNPRVTSHGSVSQKELAAKLKSAAFLTYPCIVEETFCLAALEALAAGMKVIASGTGGIPNTTSGFGDLIPLTQSTDKNQFIAAYRQALEKNIAAFTNDPSTWAERQFAQVQSINKTCNWAMRAKQWEDYIETARASR